MVDAIIFLEGASSGPDSGESQKRCREAFHRLLENSGFKDRKPRLVACGSRKNAFEDFKNAHARNRGGIFIAMWIDSEDPLQDLEAAWSHLKPRRDDQWTRPVGAKDDQVLFMTTCMETWIVADRDALKKHYRGKLQISALPPLDDLESRHRDKIREQLTHATRNCKNAYAKGTRSFEVLAKLSPAALDALPSFKRVRRILNQNLPPAR